VHAINWVEHPRIITAALTVENSNVSPKGIKQNVNPFLYARIHFSGQ